MPTPQETLDKMLFLAFVAGFEVSGEGFNGEFVSSSITTEQLEALLRERFEEFLARWPR